MRVAVEIEIAEICSHFLGAARSDLTHSHEASQGLEECPAQRTCQQSDAEVNQGRGADYAWPRTSVGAPSYFDAT
jgi:hypothetical protein